MQLQHLQRQELLLGVQMRRQSIAIPAEEELLVVEDQTVEGLEAVVVTNHVKFTLCTRTAPKFPP
ncbi:MAG: hypothetical protein EOP84_37010 [Verrucomicrobiaceae bacterium]|nr:MAG: hypothetical protein EOP84_37010 [Verrucomicrobiaceae bacterium]